MAENERIFQSRPLLTRIKVTGEKRSKSVLHEAKKNAFWIFPNGILFFLMHKRIGGAKGNVQNTSCRYFSVLSTNSMFKVDSVLSFTAKSGE